MKNTAMITFFLLVSLNSPVCASDFDEMSIEMHSEIPSEVYVSKILDGNIVAIDVTTDDVIAFLRAGKNPAEIAVMGSANRAFVADLNDGTLTVINTSDRKTVETLELGNPIAAVDIDIEKRIVYALDFSNGSPGTNMHVINGDTNIETADFSIGSRLQNIAVDAEENLAYATDFVDGIIIIDTQNNTVLTTIPMMNNPHGIAVNPGTDRLFVTQLDSDSVVVIDTMTRAVIDTLSVGDIPQWIELDISRNKAFVTNEGDGTVSVIDISTNTVLSDTIPVGPNPLTVTIHSGAAKAYVYNTGDGTISIIDTINETVIATIDMLFGDGFESGEVMAWSYVSQ